MNNIKKLLIGLSILALPISVLAYQITVPASTGYGQVLIGNYVGEYTPVATSTLGITSGTVTAVTGTFPISSNGGATPNITFTGLGTSSAAVIGNIPYYSGVNTFANSATGTVTCSGTASCGAGSYVLGSNLTITGAAGTNASSTLLADWNAFTGKDTFTNLTATQATTTQLNMGTYQTMLHAAGLYLDTQDYTPPSTETRLLSNFTDPNVGAESTASLVVDCSGQNAFNNQNYFDRSIDYYPGGNAVYAGFAIASAGTCGAIPFELQVRGANQNVQQSVTMAAMPSGTIGFINSTNGTSTIPLNAKVYIASTTATYLLAVDAGTGTVANPGTPALTVFHGGNVSLGSLSSNRNLDVYDVDTDTSFANTSTGIGLYNTSNTTNNWNRISFAAADQTLVASIESQVTNQASHLGGITFGSRSASGYNRVMDINNNAVGVGTTTPGNTLSVQGNTYSAGLTTSSLFTATTTSLASIFPLASTTVLSIGGTNVTPYAYRSFTLATTTAWTGTTTARSLAIGAGEIVDATRCDTDVGTLTVNISVAGGNNIYIQASTTPGINTPSLTFTSAATVSVSAGLPASSPTQVVCTLKTHLNAITW